MKRLWSKSLVDVTFWEVHLLNLFFYERWNGGSYLVEAVIVCKQLLARQNVIIAERYIDKLQSDRIPSTKAIRYFTKELWMVCKDKLKCLAIYNFVFPSLKLPPTNKDTIVFMAIKMLWNTETIRRL